MQNTTTVSVRKIYDELCKINKITHIPKATLLELAWESFKKTKEYSKLVLGIK